jgi:phosphohistidine swiveling domain-containing protein
MSPATFRHLADVRMADASEVGGKAAGLGELFAEGAHVPAGVVLTAGLGALIVEDRAALVRAASADLGNGPFAVRSSGVDEDGSDRSYAGMFESVLDVPPEGLVEATERCLASAHAGRVADYQPSGNGRMAVIIQQMVAAAAAGVALTADPINGDRHSAVVTAVRGTGDRLVSGATQGDQWVVTDGGATARHRPEEAIDRRQAMQVATEARRIAAERGQPQDIEWAIDGDGALWLLQARPMTALPPDVSWESPAPGAFTRQVRFGEWISEPVTPLFESWLLTAMENRFHDLLLKLLGQRIPGPNHVVVNGWYFYTLNWATPGAFARNLPNMLWHLIRTPRVVAGINPSTVRHAFPLVEREWRDDLQPRYRAAVADAEARVETLHAEELPALIDRLAELAGDYFLSIAALTGAAYKLEMNLASFYRKHLGGARGAAHLPLLAGFDAPADPDRHAVVSLDWWHPTSPMTASAVRRPEDHRLLVEAREAAEAAAVAKLTSSPRRLRAFRRLLADAQHLVPIRDEQTRELSLPWPVMRRAVLRIGEALTGRGVIAKPEDAFWLTRREALAGLAGAPLAQVDVGARRALHEEQARLVPPLLVGRLSPVLRSMWATFQKVIGAAPSARALVSGTPASAGRASGPVRVIRGPQDFEELLPGEILVAPLTAPAWTPLFNRAAAVVTDVGSAASHASIIAREYGIPAVVGCGDATARLRTGMRVTVDGTTGNVEPEQAVRG